GEDPSAGAERGGIGDALAADLGAGGAGALEQQGVEVAAREDGDLAVELEQKPAAAGAGELAFGDEIALDLERAQEGKLAQRLVGEAAAAGLFPGELFIEEHHLAAGLGEAGGGHGAGGAAADDGDRAGGAQLGLRNGFSMRTPRRVWPWCRSSVSRRAAPERSAATIISASQKLICASSSTSAAWVTSAGWIRITDQRLY